MLVKIHESYRKIIAVCDSELLGKKIEEGNMQLDMQESFYGGDEKDEKEIIELLSDLYRDDATFNLVGEQTINTAIKSGIIDEIGVMKIQGVPYALGLI
ncbi:MAG: DUF424 family protein [archaeon]